MAKLPRSAAIPGHGGEVDTLGGGLVGRSGYLGAMDWVRRVLAMDPGNAEAKELQRTIAIAGAASTGGWGWGWGGRDL